MKRDFLLWLIALALLGNLLAMGYLIHRWMKQDREQEAEAEKVAREALDINLLDEETQEILIKALKAQKKDDEAARIKRLLQD